MKNCHLKKAVIDNLSPDTAYSFTWVAMFDFGRTDPTEATQSSAPAAPKARFSTTFLHSNTLRPEQTHINLGISTDHF